MIKQRKSRSHILCFALILLVAAASAVAQTPAGDCPEATITQGASTRDRVVHQQDGRSLLVDIYRLTGIGRMKVQHSAPGCPASVVIRLHDFQELESLRVRTPDAELACEQMRVEGKRPRLVCRLGQRQIDASQHKPDYVEVTLPPVLIDSGAPVEIHWVDQWR